MPDPIDSDGWHIWDMSEAGTWPATWAPIRYRREGAHMAIRAEAPAHAGNLHGMIHGAFLAGLAEHAAGVFLRAADVPCVTISIAFDYPAAASLGRTLEGRVELIRETGRMQFLRLLIGQGDDVAIHGTATLRKLS
ncbi:PaaI family thioesterase [Sphingomonas crocodyli]|uniref:PaaI family thioesterase n=1 Tax=Sphingomonas crocodyli TaxID=1979270 RepID=A0A437MA60_9SPHN|nr:PaaI family thioesterase [Sphingomonas crocodyli]RVT94535.1 PaaI family thioesterase [Sphingomonas crocodyli]